MLYLPRSSSQECPVVSVLPATRRLLCAIRNTPQAMLTTLITLM
jgi:hypothetical protein